MRKFSAATSLTRFSKALVLTLSLTFALSSVAFAEELITRNAGAELKSSPMLKGKVVAKLKAKEKLTSIQKKGLFWKVKTKNGKVGYVILTKVQLANAKTSSKLRAAMRSALQEKNDDKSVSRSRTKNAVMGIRGLSDGEDLSNVGNLKPNLRALDFLESMEVDSKKVAEIQEQVLNEMELKNDGL